MQLVAVAATDRLGLSGCDIPQRHQAVHPRRGKPAFRPARRPRAPARRILAVEQGPVSVRSRGPTKPPSRLHSPIARVRSSGRESASKRFLRLMPCRLISRHPATAQSLRQRCGRPRIRDTPPSACCRAAKTRGRRPWFPGKDQVRDQPTRLEIPHLNVPNLVAEGQPATVCSRGPDSSGWSPGTTISPPPAQVAASHRTTAPSGWVTARKVLLSGKKAGPQNWTASGKTAIRRRQPSPPGPNTAPSRPCRPSRDLGHP